MTLSTLEVVGTEHCVERNGLRLSIWEKQLAGDAEKPVLVLAHGSATAGRGSFDLQVPGKPSYSLMDFLAARGFDVFAPDVRGFGRSTRPEAGVTTAQASEDLDTVIDHVRALRGAERVNLLAWSWGTQYGGMLVMNHPEKVERYVSYAQMHVNSPDLTRRRARLPTFRERPYASIPEAGWKQRFYSMTPEGANDPQVVDAFAQAASAVERVTPNGPQIDMATLLPMVDPRLLKVPTMIVHGRHDDVADEEGLLPFFALLPNPHKRYVVIPDAGHMLHMQQGHRLFQKEIAGFFDAPLS